MLTIHVSRKCLLHEYFLGRDIEPNRHGGWNGYLDDWSVPEYYKNMDSLEGNHFESLLHTQSILERKKIEK